ncbi:MAG TPA: proton-conducting transporter membrane subunit [Candidatus Dormibacteraeota bacterium]|nr:proton-conducting transporter membrane subunit [Candidatus Dormibacteraeota bacterium]
MVAIIALGVRGRRTAANLAVLAPLASLVGVALAGASQFKTSPPYTGSYEWLNVATAFSGPARFQTYITDIGIRVTHLTTLLMACALVISLAVLAWSRAGARGEPSPARYYGLLTLLLACTLGVIVSTDLSEIYVFWGVAAIASWLLLSNAWADPASTLAARLSLAVPAISDLSLLAGIAVLYSRYGQLAIDQLIPGMTQLGPQPKSLGVAAILILVGAVGRLGLFPFQGWLTGAGPASGGALAAVQGFWTLIVAGLLYKVMPIIVSADLLTHWIPGKSLAATAAVSAVLLPLLGLASLDVRKAVIASGIGVSAIAVLAFTRPGDVAAAAVLLAVTGLARTAATLATGSLVAGMRTSLINEMGEGWRRMRLSVAALPLAAAALVAGVGVVAGGTLRWYWVLAYALGLGLASLGFLRVYLLTAYPYLPRRRGFDPNRVRPAAESMSYPPLVLGLLALGLSVAFYWPSFLGWTDNRPHPAGDPTLFAYWLAVPVGGALLATVLFSVSRSSGARLTTTAAAGWERVAFRGRLVLDRLLVEPALTLAERTEDDVVPGAEDNLRQLVEESAQLVRRPLAVIPILVGVAVLLAVIAGLVAPAVYR